MSSILTGSIHLTFVPVAQRIRHLTTNQGIVGSNPTGDVFLFYRVMSTVEQVSGVKKIKKVLPGLEPGSLDSESRVITITL